MRKKKGKDKRHKKTVSRRDFIKESATIGGATIVSMVGITTAEAARPEQALPGAPRSVESDPMAVGQGKSAEPRTLKVYRHAILFALGDTLIPSAPNDPGYKDLEWYGITEEVNSRLDELPDKDLDLFDKSSIALLKKKFTELSEEKRADYFNHILQSGGIKDEALQKRLKEIYSHVREVVFTIYYQNFPEDSWPRDSMRVPLLKTGDAHQITNPSSSGIVTGWDLAGYAGPLTWEEEERRRNFFKKIAWQE